MESKQPGAKFSCNILSRVLDDDSSVGSDKSRQPVPAQLFFQSSAVKVETPIGEASLSDNYPLCDMPWSFWITDQHANDHKLSTIFTGPYLGPRPTLVSNIFLTLSLSL